MAAKVQIFFDNSKYYLYFLIRAGKGNLHKNQKNTVFLLCFSQKMCKFAAEIKALTTKR